MFAGPPTLHVDSIEGEEGEHLMISLDFILSSTINSLYYKYCIAVVDQPTEEDAPHNGTYDVQGRGGGGREEGMDEEAEERQEDQSVRVHIEAVVMRYTITLY